MANKAGLRTLSIDIGGTGIKAIVLDKKGRPITERARVRTPQPPTPRVVLKAIKALAAGQGAYDRVSLGFPGVVRDGVAETAHNLDQAWVGFNLGRALTKLLGKPARVANDADLQGCAAVKGKGVELVITLGTGLGSALFLEGKLVPNLELAHHCFRKGKTYEELLGKAALDRFGQKRWNRLLRRALQQWNNLFNYDHLYLGGGNAGMVALPLPKNVSVVPNVYGLLGGIVLWRDTARRASR